MKKLLPFAALAAAIVFFVWVKNNQRGTKDSDVFSRDYKSLSYSKHAHCRMDCRQIDESEVKDILKNGTVNYSKTEKSSKGVSYALEGMTRDSQHVRIVFSPHGSEVVVVTAIDLDKEWPCDCE